MGCVLADLMGNTGWRLWIVLLEHRWETYFNSIFRRIAFTEDQLQSQLKILNSVCFEKNYHQAPGEEGWFQLANDLDERKKDFFPNWNDPNTVDYWIFQCLMLEPSKRPSAQTVASKLKEIYNKLRL